MHWSGKRFAGCWWFRSQPAGNPQQNFRRLPATRRANALTWDFWYDRHNLSPPNAQEFSFASRRSASLLTKTSSTLSKSSGATGDKRNTGSYQGQPSQSEQPARPRDQAPPQSEVSDSRSAG
jgi:hypothetical protein